MSDDKRTDAHLKLDQILDRMTALEARDTERQGTLAAILTSMDYCGDALGTLVVEVGKLSEEAAKEPKSDIGATLRRLSEAVEKNTAATQQLVAQLTARRGSSHQ